MGKTKIKNQLYYPNRNTKHRVLRPQQKTDSVCKLSQIGAVWGDLGRFCFTCLLMLIFCTKQTQVQERA